MGIFNTTHQTLGRGGGAESELYKSSGRMRLRKLPGWWTVQVPGRWHTQRRHGSSLYPSPVPGPMDLLHLAVLSCILCNILVNISKVFTWVLSSSVKFLNLRSESWEPLIIAGWSEVHVAQGLWLTSAMGASCGVEPFELVGSGVSVRSGLSCWTLSWCQKESRASAVGIKSCEVVSPGGQESSGELKHERQVMSYSTQECGRRVLQGKEAV